MKRKENLGRAKNVVIIVSGLGKKQDITWPEVIVAVDMVLAMSIFKHVSRKVLLSDLKAHFLALGLELNPIEFSLLEDAE